MRLDKAARSIFKPLRGRFRLLLQVFQSHYFRPQPLDLAGLRASWARG
jgi:hypothetical protein